MCNIVMETAAAGEKKSEGGGRGGGNTCIRVKSQFQTQGKLAMSLGSNHAF